MFHQTASIGIRVYVQAAIRAGGELGRTRQPPMGLFSKRVPVLAVFLGPHSRGQETLPCRVCVAAMRS
jgi:hypothetical protein